MRLVFDTGKNIVRLPNGYVGKVPAVKLPSWWAEPVNRRLTAVFLVLPPPLPNSLRFQPTEHSLYGTNAQNITLVFRRRHTGKYIGVLH